MGAGIACAALMAGIRVRIKEIDERQTAAAMSRVKGVSALSLSHSHSLSAGVHDACLLACLFFARFLAPHLHACVFVPAPAFSVFPRSDVLLFAQASLMGAWPPNA